MRINKLLRLIGLICICNFIAISAIADSIHISRRDALKIGVKIWYNESAGTVLGLTSWNRGEDFASMGIGHFIWYPADAAQTYRESFPALLRYLASQGISIPYWLQAEGYSCPWQNREIFLHALYTPEMIQLRQFLLETIPWQASFMVRRLQAALPRILARVPVSERPYIRDQFMRIAATPQGIYVLVDYVNFKGEGINAEGDYQNKGWGLLQVLEEMKNAPSDMDVLQAFAWAANQVLTRRVERSPRWLDEQRWLSGWRKRLETYYS